MTLGLLLSIGCNADGLTAQQQANLDNALDAYRTNETSTTIAQCNVLLQQEPSFTQRGFLKARYLRALAHIRLKNVPAARRDIEQVLTALDDPMKFKFPNQADDLEVKSRDTLGELDFQANNFESAKGHFEFVLKAIAPESQPADHAAYRMGCIAQRQGRWSQADTYFQQLHYFNANSPMAVEAKRRSFAKTWCVQLGLYGNYANATAYAARLTQAGWKARCVPLARQSKSVYALRVGQWNTYNEAKLQLPRLRTLERDAFILPNR